MPYLVNKQSKCCVRQGRKSFAWRCKNGPGAESRSHQSSLRFATARNSGARPGPEFNHKDHKEHKAEAFFLTFDACSRSIGVGRLAEANPAMREKTGGCSLRRARRYGGQAMFPFFPQIMSLACRVGSSRRNQVKAEARRSWMSINLSHRLAASKRCEDGSHGEGGSTTTRDEGGSLAKLGRATFCCKKALDTISNSEY